MSLPVPCSVARELDSLPVRGSDSDSVFKLVVVLRTYVVVPLPVVGNNLNQAKSSESPSLARHGPSMVPGPARGGGGGTRRGGASSLSSHYRARHGGILLRIHAAVNLKFSHDVGGVPVRYIKSGVRLRPGLGARSEADSESEGLSSLPHTT
jgi:hypothetical protein